MNKKADKVLSRVQLIDKMILDVLEKREILLSNDWVKNWGKTVDSINKLYDRNAEILESRANQKWPGEFGIYMARLEITQILQRYKDDPEIALDEAIAEYIENDKKIEILQGFKSDMQPIVDDIFTETEKLKASTDYLLEEHQKSLWYSLVEEKYYDPEDTESKMAFEAVENVLRNYGTLKESIKDITDQITDYESYLKDLEPISAMNYSSSVYRHKREYQEYKKDHINPRTHDQVYMGDGRSNFNTQAELNRARRQTVNVRKKIRSDSDIVGDSALERLIESYEDMIDKNKTRIENLCIIIQMVDTALLGLTYEETKIIRSKYMAAESISNEEIWTSLKIGKSSFHEKANNAMRKLIKSLDLNQIYILLKNHPDVYGLFLRIA